jgi:hypothetical protein
MVGVIEAVAFLGIGLEGIEVLSVGTTTTPFNIAEHSDSGIAQWNAGLLDLFFQGQTESALAQAKLLLNGRFHRINATVKGGEFSLDDARPEKIRRLINLGRGEAVKKDNIDVVKARFLNEMAAPAFVPLYSPRA